MALQNCNKCGKLIGETPSGFCDTCKVDDPSYSNLHKVKDFLYDNPNSTMIAVSEATGVTVAEIAKFIREGAIVEMSMVSSDSNGKCSCGKPVEGNARLCPDCKRENERAADQARKSLARNIEPAAKAAHTSGFFTKSK